LFKPEDDDTEVTLPYLFVIILDNSSILILIFC
jgi:hypothetical protein